ncbi:hypothetical protein GCM10011521_20220 [Arenimonas soli]|uniref:Phosphatidate cytidylyltransferase n=1 Tax=Arenimonas soli TaxID=2269504 RepID=A0ABQ1HKV3_9GAMM|nr:hypothetical protein [Arenimonas soli]GGA81824.1 hypothetical protein GCM10011521_20220 [Arenimonas soli]
MTLSPQLLDEVQWLRVAVYLVLGPIAVGHLCTYLKLRHGWASGYTRKLNHLGIMLITAPLLAVLPDTQLIMSVLVATSLQVVLYTSAAYSERPLLHALAVHSLRERDAPRSRFFFLMPMITTNVSLVAAVLLFPMLLVKIAFFTVAVADGMAEPVGLRFGKGNTYQIPDLVWGGRNTKSIAGSGAVFVLALATSLLLLSWVHGLTPAVLLTCGAYATAMTLLEAVSPRGSDNMLMILLGPLFLMGLMHVTALAS